MIKTKPYQLLFLLILILSTGACKKKEIQYSFEGTITNALDNSKLSGVSVTLSQKKVKNGGTSENFSTVASDQTDASGFYSFTIAREKVTSFLFEFEKENFFNLDQIETTANVTTDGVNTFNAVLEPQSWVQFEIKNSFPNETDHFKFITHNFREGCEGCAENRTVDFHGSLDTVLNYVTTAGEYVKFTYINVTNGTSNTDSIYTTPFETQIFPITY